MELETKSLPIRKQLEHYELELDWINKLKKDKNAIILAHSYQRPEIVFGIADYIGDSLELCRKAQQTKADLVVFCGVYFMAESAAILNPDKKVILPDLEARCSFMDGYSLPNGKNYPGISPNDIKELKRLFPNLPVECYVNTAANVKAESDICCTSANDIKIAEELGDRVIFVPDRNMGENIANVTNRNFIVVENNGDWRYKLIDNSREQEISYEKAKDTVYSERSLVGWNGRCIVHDTFTTEDAEMMRKMYPEIKILAHKECGPDVRKFADFVGGTGEAKRYIEQSDSDTFMFITECGTPGYFQEIFPNKKFIGSCTECPYMHKIDLTKVLVSLQEEEPVVSVPEPVNSRARKSLERMLEF